MRRLNTKKVLILLLIYILWLGAVILFAPNAHAGPPVTPIISGGTGTSTSPAYGNIPIGGKNGEYEFVASSTFPSFAPVQSVFGRTGAVSAQSGDYNTSQVTESGNQYFTNARAQAALSGLYEVPLTFTYPLQRLVNAISSAFGTTTSNTWAGTQTFTNTPVLGSLTGFIKAASGVLSTALISLTSDITGTLGVANGGTGSTTLTGILKGNGTGQVQTAVAGNDYLAPSSLSAGTGISYSNGVITNTIGYPFPSNATGTTLTLGNGFVSQASSTMVGNATTTGMEGVGSLFINNQRFTNLLGSGLSNGAGALTVSGLTTGNLASANVSQFTNDAGYITSAGSGAPYAFTPSTFGTLNVSATTTALQAYPGLIAATSTIGNLTASSSITNQGVKSALVLDSAAGLEGAYGGSSNPCAANQAPTTLSATGALGGCTGTFLTSAITALGNYATTTGTAISLSTSTVTVNGLTYGNTIAVSPNGILVTPTVTGTYTGQAGSVANAVTFNNSGSGASSGQTYNGSGATTISYNTIGAQPAGSYDTFAYPFLNSATSSTLTFSGGLVSNGSTTVSGLSSGLVGNNNGLLYGLASSSLFGFIPLNPTRAVNTTYPIQGGGDLSADRTFLLAFGTTTANAWSQLQQFNGGASTTQLTTTGNFWLNTTGYPQGIIGALDSSPNFNVEVNSQGQGSYTSVGLKNGSQAGGMVLDTTDTFNGLTNFLTLTNINSPMTCLGFSNQTLGCAYSDNTLDTLVDFYPPSGGKEMTYTSSLPQGAGTVFSDHGNMNYDFTTGLQSFDIIASTKYAQPLPTYIRGWWEQQNGNTSEATSSWDYFIASTTPLGAYGTTTVIGLGDVGSSTYSNTNGWNNGINLNGPTIQIVASTTRYQALGIFKGGIATSTQLLGIYNDGTASTSKLLISGISNCNTTSALTTNSAGNVSCGAITGSGGAAYSFTPDTFGALNVSATSSPLKVTSASAGFIASSTSWLDSIQSVNASTTNLNATGNITIGNTGAIPASMPSQSLVSAGGASFGSNVWITPQGRGLWFNSVNTFAPGIERDTSNNLAFIGTSNNPISWSYLAGQGYWGLGSSTPMARLSIQANPTDYAFTPLLFAIGSSTATATTTLFSVSNIGSTTIGNFGACSGTNALTTTAAGTIVCGAITGSGSSFAYPFPASATSSPLMLLASTTIGNGTQNGGLTVSGGSTTTLNAFVGSTLQLGVPVNYDTGDIQFLNSSNSPVGRISVPGGSDFWLHNNNTDATIRLTLSRAYDNDQGVAFQYTPGAVSAGTGVLAIGQLAKNAGSFTHGVTELFTNGIDRLHIDVNGNVGISTTTPGSTLSVGGNGYFSGTVNTSATTGGYKIDNQMFATASSTSGLTLVGLGAGSALTATTSVNGNTAFGNLALNVSTSSRGMTAFGYQALQNAIDYATQRDTAIGWEAGRALTTATQMTALGNSSLLANTTGSSNTALGFSTLPAVTSGFQNTAVGATAGNLVTGSNNTLIGFSTGSSLTSGANNILIGSQMDVPTSGTANYLDIGNILYGRNNSGTGNTYSSGQVGVGSSTPWSRFAIHLNNLDTNTMAFAIGSSAQTATTTLFTIDNTGKVTNVNGDIFSQPFTAIVSTSSATGQYTSIAAALAAIPTPLGGKVHIRCGDYTISSELLIAASSTILEGEGLCTRILFDGSVVPKALGISTSTVEDVQIRDLYIHQTNATWQGIGMDASNTPLLYVNNIKIDNTATSTSINDTVNRTFYQNWTNIDLRNNNNCMDIGGGTSTPSGSQPTVQNTVTNLRCALNTNGTAGTGIYINSVNANGAQNWNFQSPDIEMPSVNANQVGIHIVNGFASTFTNLFEEDLATGVQIDSPSARITFVSGQILLNTTNVTDNGTDDQFLNTTVGSSLYNKGAPLEIFDKAANRIALFIHNAVTFANTLTDYIKFQLTNSSDTANLLNLSNAGTGATLIATSSRGTDMVLLGSNGNFGIGTTTPWRQLSVGSSNTGKFAISTSTSGCATFSSLGELYSTGSVCGSGGSLTGSTGQIAYFSGTNTAVGTSSLAISTNGQVTNKNGDVFTAPASYVVSTSTATGNFTDVQSAINALPAGGGNIQVRCGTYTLPTATYGILVKVANTVIQGDGTCTQFNFDKANTPNAFGMNATGLSGIQLSNMYFHQTNGTRTGSIGINASNTPLLIANQIKIDGTATSVSLTDSVNQTFYQDWKNMDLRDNNTCLQLGNGSSNPVNDNTFENIRCAQTSGNTGFGVYMDSNGSVGTQNNTFINMDCEPTGAATGLTCIYANRAIGNNFITPYIEGNGTAWNFTSLSLQNSMQGGTVLTSQTTTNKGIDNTFNSVFPGGSTFNLLLSSTTVLSQSTNDAGADMMYFTNNTNFAQTGNGVDVNFLNSTDSGNLFKGTNPGTGAGLWINSTGTGQAASTTGKVFMNALGAATSKNAVCVDAATGQLDNAGNTTCTTSSFFTKQDIQPLTLDALAETMKLSTVQFAYKDSPTVTHYGLIAEDVQKIDPLLVNHATAVTKLDGHTFKVGDPYAIDTEHLTDGLLVKDIQQLQTEIQALQRFGVAAKRSAEENWQWAAIILLTCGLVYQNRRISKLEKRSRYPHRHTPRD